ncbi:MAG TPA: PspA/IM30 family protein [Acidobacteriaceae bacterium]
MALLERVGTLLRANVNDLIDRAEDPEKMLKQLVLDMENQLLQLKTQVAIAIADQHLLEKKRAEHIDGEQGWRKKAELAVGKGQDDLARAALERSLSHKHMAESFAEQLSDQKAEAESLRDAFTKLQQKLKETQSRCELLIVEHRRARALGKAEQAHRKATQHEQSAAFARLSGRVANKQAMNSASHALRETASLDERFALMEREEEIETLLQELKSKQLKQLA